MNVSEYKGDQLPWCLVPPVRGEMGGAEHSAARSHAECAHYYRWTGVQLCGG